MTPDEVRCPHCDVLVELAPDLVHLLAQWVTPTVVTFWVQVWCPHCQRLVHQAPCVNGEGAAWTAAGSDVVQLRYPDELDDEGRTGDLPAITAYEVVTWAEAMADGWLEDALDREVTRRNGGMK